MSDLDYFSGNSSISMPGSNTSGFDLVGAITNAFSPSSSGSSNWSGANLTQAPTLGFGLGGNDGYSGVQVGNGGFSFGAGLFPNTEVVNVGGATVAGDKIVVQGLRDYASSNSLEDVALVVGGLLAAGLLVSSIGGGAAPSGTVEVSAKKPVEPPPVEPPPAEPPAKPPPAEPPAEPPAKPPPAEPPVVVPPVVPPTDVTPSTDPADPNKEVPKQEPTADEKSLADKLGIPADLISTLLKYGLPALASYLSYKDAANAREEARGWSALGGYAKQAVRSPGGGVTFKPAGKAAGGVASLAGGGIASLADGGIASLAGGGNILDEEIKTYITNVLGNKKSQQEQAAEINAAAQKYNIGRDRIAQATGYGSDAVKQFLGPNIIGQKTAAAPYQVYDKASDTYRYVDAAGYEKWLSGIPLTPTNRVQGSPVYYGAPSKAEGYPDIGGGSLDYVPSMSEEPDETLSLPRYDMYGNQLEDDPNLETMTEAETEEFEKNLALDPESRARLLEPLRNAFMSTNAVGDLDVQQMLRNIYNNPETRELFYEYTNQLKDAPYDAAEWFQKYNELVQRSEGEGFTPDREYMPLKGIELAQINRENRYLPRNIANEMFRLVAPNTPDTVIKNYGDVKGNLPEDYVVTDRGQAIEPNQGLNVNDLYYGDLYYGAPLSEMGVTGGGGGKRGGVVHRPHYAAGGMTTKQPFYLGGITDGMADEVPAHIDNKRPAALSDGEFVIPADVVSHLGNGNSNAGAKRLYEMMDRIREARTGNSKQGIQVNPNNFMPG